MPASCNCASAPASSMPARLLPGCRRPWPRRPGGPAHGRLHGDRQGLDKPSGSPRTPSSMPAAAARSLAGAGVGQPPAGGLRALLLAAVEFDHAAALRVPAARCGQPNRALTQFITLRFGQPGYCLLSGDVPLAVWKGADNGSQIGSFSAFRRPRRSPMSRFVRRISAGQSGAGVFLFRRAPCPNPCQDGGLRYTAALRRCWRRRMTKASTSFLTDRNWVALRQLGH